MVISTKDQLCSCFSEVSSDKNYIIGGAVGGGVAVLVIIVIIVSICVVTRRYVPQIIYANHSRYS